MTTLEGLIFWFFYLAGIGIVYLTLVDQEGNDVIAQPCYPMQCYTHYSNEEMTKTLDNLLLVKRYEELTEEDTNICKFHSFNFPYRGIAALQNYQNAHK